MCSCVTLRYSKGSECKCASVGAWTCSIYCVVPKKSILPYQEFFCFAPPHSPGNLSLASFFPSKTLAFKTPPSPTLGISMDLLLRGDAFWSHTFRILWYAVYHILVLGVIIVVSFFEGTYMYIKVSVFRGRDYDFLVDPLAPICPKAPELYNPSPSILCIHVPVP